MKGSNDLALKTISIVCFIAIAISVVIASNSVATGYELSIYTETPILVWFLLLVGAIGGIWLIADQAFRDTTVAHLGIVVGPLVLANLTILFLPTLRGYFLYSSYDSLSHIGRGLDILLTGHTETENVYPVTHILMAQLSQVCGMAPISVERFLPVLLNLVFVIMATYLIGKISLPEHGQRLLVFAFASGFLLNSLHVMVYTQVMSFFFVLLALYLRLYEVLNQRPAGRISLIIVLFAIPYSHPTPTLMAIFFLLAIELANALYRRVPGYPIIRQISINLPLISAITFFTWISSFVLFDVKVSTLWANLRAPFAAPQVEALENTMGDIGISSLVSILLKMYGDTFLCLLLAIGGTLIVTKEHWSGKRRLSSAWALAVVFLTSVPVQLLIFAGARSQTVGRLLNLNFALFLAPVLAAYALYQILRRVGRARAVVASSILVLAVWIIGASGVYHSPWILQPSWQVTRMDARGTEWFLQHKDTDIPFGVMGFPYGVQYAERGYRAVFSREDFRAPMLQALSDVERVLPSGFGYGRFTTLAESVNQDEYLMIARRFQLATADPTLSSQGLRVIPLFWSGFRPTDFTGLEKDPSVNKLYSNGEWDIWRVSVWPHGD